jgi:hypothetical protein
MSILFLVGTVDLTVFPASTTSKVVERLLPAIGIARSRRFYRVGAWELEATPFDSGPTWHDHHARHRELEHRPLAPGCAHQPPVRGTIATASPAATSAAAGRRPARPTVWGVVPAGGSAFDDEPRGAG